MNGVRSLSAVLFGAQKRTRANKGEETHFFKRTNFSNIPPIGGVKKIGGVIFITILLHFCYFISLQTANTQKSEVFLLKISLGNVNATVVTCRYPPIYNFSFRKEILEIL